MVFFWGVAELGLIVGSVAKCSDLADLWYKEFYLELSKQVQVKYYFFVRVRLEVGIFFPLQ